MGKHKYHSDLILQYKLGLLPHIVEKSIPTSTRHYWRSNNYSDLLGREFGMLDNEKDIDMVKLMVQNQKLRNIAKALYFTLNTLKSASRKLNATDLKLDKNSIQSIDKCISLIGMKKSFKLWKISSSQYHYWKSKTRCYSSILNRCFKVHPNQLTNLEMNTIKRYLSLTKYSHWSLASLYYLMLRKREAFMSLATFYKYANLLGAKRRKVEKPKQRPGLKATYPYQYLHMDVTQLRFKNGKKAYIYVLMDNYSRKILSLKASYSYSAKLCFENLEKGIAGIKNLPELCSIVTDDGSENKGDVVEYINSVPYLQKLIAQKQIIYSNSMVESFNRKLKYDYLFRHSIDNLETLEHHLKQIPDDYNNRPFHALKGLTPNEAVSESFPNRYNFKNKIKQAKSLRLIYNSINTCRSCKTPEKKMSQYWDT